MRKKKKKKKKKKQRDEVDEGSEPEDTEIFQNVPFTTTQVFFCIFITKNYKVLKASQSKQKFRPSLLSRF